MKITVLSTALLACMASHAQQEPGNIHAYRFRAEGRNMYQVSGCTPGSGISFYSRPHGGQLLRTAQAGADGSLLLETESNFKPAFVLNDPVSDKGIAGTGMVTHLGSAYAFSIDHTELGVTGSDHLISWQAAVSDRGNYVFEILKCNDNGSCTVIGTRPALAGDGAAWYFFTCPAVPGTVYRIRVQNPVQQVSYTSKPLQLPGEQHAAITQETGTDHVKVVFKENDAHTTYQLVNIQGQVLMKGNLPAAENEVSTAGLSMGVYLLVVYRDNTVMSCTRFVKP